jgi:hypothetical protein
MSPSKMFSKYSKMFTPCKYTFGLCYVAIYFLNYFKKQPLATAWVMQNQVMELL